jgi:hypothetical protein
VVGPYDTPRTQAKSSVGRKNPLKNNETSGTSIDNWMSTVSSPTTNRLANPNATAGKITTAITGEATSCVAGNGTPVAQVTANAEVTGMKSEHDTERQRLSN